MTLVYVHALTSAAALGGPRRAVRVAGRRIELVRIGRIAAAVERIGTAPSLSEASLRAQHAIVCRLSRRFDAVLPVRFGASVEPGELRRIVTAREKTLLRALQAVRGCDQMTLRIRGSSGRPPAAARARTGAAYLRSRYRAARPVLPPIARGIRRAVAPIVFRERIDAGPVRGQIAIHHLVPRARVRRYQSIVQSVLGDGAAAVVTLSGPWPPFAFAPEIWP